MSLNRVTLVGRLVRDPEIRTTITGKNVADFTIAVTMRVKSTDPSQPDANFFRCKAWNQQADFISQYGGKGRMVGLEGRLESRRFQDKDGIQRETIEIVCDHVALLDRPKDEAPTAPQSEPRKQLVGAGSSRSKAKTAAAFDPFAD